MIITHIFVLAQKISRFLKKINYSNNTSPDPCPPPNVHLSQISRVWSSSFIRNVSRSTTKLSISSPLTPSCKFFPVFSALGVRSLFKKAAKIIFRIFTVGFCGFNQCKHEACTSGTGSAAGK